LRSLDDRTLRGSTIRDDSCDIENLADHGFDRADRSRDDDEIRVTECPPNGGFVACIAHLVSCRARSLIGNDVASIDADDMRRERPRARSERE
jgi:hypothetical protein